MSTPNSSLPSSPGAEQPPADLNADELPDDDEKEEIVHLVPCTWQEFLELEPPASGYYEYVDGFVIWCPNMADAEHVQMVTDHATVLNSTQDLKVVQVPSIQIVNDQNHVQTTTAREQHPTDRNRASSSTDHNRGSSSTDRNRASSSTDRNRASSSTDRNRASSSTDRNRGSSSTDRNRGSSSTDRNRASSSTDRNRGSSSSDPSRIQCEMRHPDFVIEQLRSGESSTTERGNLEKKRIFYAHPLTTKLQAIVEVTSHSTRQTDLNAKWRAYARTKVQMYIILDRGTESGRNRRVIVGTLNRLRSVDQQSSSGDKQTPPPRRSSRTAGQDRPIYFYRREYSLTEIVDCPHYVHLNLTAQKLLDSEFMKNLAKQKDEERKQEKQRRQEVEQELAEEKRSSRQKDQKIAEKDQKIAEKDQKIAEEKRSSRQKDQKLAEIMQKLDEEKRKNEQLMKQSDKSRGGSSSQGGSPERKKSRK